MAPDSWVSTLVPELRETSSPAVTTRYKGPVFAGRHQATASGETAPPPTSATASCRQPPAPETKQAGTAPIPAAQVTVRLPQRASAHRPYRPPDRPRPAIGAPPGRAVETPGPPG